MSLQEPWLFSYFFHFLGITRVRISGWIDDRIFAVFVHELLHRRYVRIYTSHKPLIGVGSFLLVE